MQPFYGSRRTDATLRVGASSDASRPLVIVESLDVHDDRSMRIRFTTIVATRDEAIRLADLRAAQVRTHKSGRLIGVQVFEDNVPVHFAGEDV